MKRKKDTEMAKVRDNVEGEGVVAPEDGDTTRPAPSAETMTAEARTETALGAEDAQLVADRLAEAEAELNKVRDDYLRALAEVENVRRRAARDREDASKYAVTALARDLLAVADNLRRALESVDTAATSNDPSVNALIAGVEMTEKELLTAFERHGVTHIEALGRPFDPHFQEAMLEIPDPSVPKGTVVQVLQEGYKIHERPLRAARVGVSTGGPKRAPLAASTGESEAEAATEQAQSGPAAAYEKQAERDADSSGARVDEKL